MFPPNFIKFGNGQAGVPGPLDVELYLCSLTEPLKYCSLQLLDFKGRKSNQIDRQHYFFYSFYGKGSTVLTSEAIP